MIRRNHFILLISTWFYSVPMKASNAQIVLFILWIRQQYSAFLVRPMIRLSRKVSLTTTGTFFKYASNLVVFQFHVLCSRQQRQVCFVWGYMFLICRISERWFWTHDFFWSWRLPVHGCNVYIVMLIVRCLTGTNAWRRTKHCHSASFQVQMRSWVHSFDSCSLQEGTRNGLRWAVT